MCMCVSWFFNVHMHLFEGPAGFHTCIIVCVHVHVHVYVYVYVYVRVCTVEKHISMCTHTLASSPRVLLHSGLQAQRFTGCTSRTQLLAQRLTGCTSRHSISIKSVQQRLTPTHLSAQHLARCTSGTSEVQQRLAPTRLHLQPPFQGKCLRRAEAGQGQRQGGRGRADGSQASFPQGASQDAPPTPAPFSAPPTH